MLHMIIGARANRTQETDHLVKRTDEAPLEPYDIISDPKTVGALSLLYNSMVSLAEHCGCLEIRLTSFSNGLQVILQNYAE